jgi:hypothetical protein
MDGLETRFAKAYLSCLPRTIYNTFDTLPDFPVLPTSPSSPPSPSTSPSNPKQPEEESSSLTSTAGTSEQQQQVDGVVSSIRGPDVKQSVDCSLEMFAVGHSMSTYSMGPKGTRLGEPICDQFCLKVLRSHKVAVCLTDGCGWGRNAKDASITTNETFIDYVLENLEFAGSLKQVAFLLLNGIFAAQNRLVQGSRSIDDVGTTTLLGGLLLQVNIGENEIEELLTSYPSQPLPSPRTSATNPTPSLRPVIGSSLSATDIPLPPSSTSPSLGVIFQRGNSYPSTLPPPSTFSPSPSLSSSNSSSSSWCFMCVSLGDCKAYRYEAKNGYMHDITWSNRSISINATDPGGRLGPQALKRGLVDSRPDTRNLNIYYTFCDANDVIIVASDGIHDNFDPEVLRLFF